jgi:hypothetical protein
VWRHSGAGPDGGREAAFTEPLSSRIGAQFGDLPTHDASVASVLLTLPLAVRTRWPAACLAVVGPSFAVHESLGCPPTFGTLGLYIALYSVGAHQDGLRRVVPLAATGGYVFFGVVLHTLGSPLDDRLPALLHGAGGDVRAECPGPLAAGA